MTGRYIHNERKRTVGSYLSSLYDYRHLLFHLASAQLRARFRRSALGVIWVVANPVILAGILGWVFGTIFGTGDIKSYMLYILIGLIVYETFSSTLGNGATAYIGAENYFKQTKIPSVLFPLNSVIYVFICFAYSCVGYIAVHAFIGGPLSWFAPLWLLASSAALFIFLTPISVLSALFGIRLPDYSSILPYGTLILYYLSPVFIPRKAFDRPLLAEFSALNPIRAALDSFRAILMDGRAPHLADLGLMVAWGVVLAIAAVIWLAHEEDRIVTRF